jgi:hypothetical protein
MIRMIEGSDWNRIINHQAPAMITPTRMRHFITLILSGSAAFTAQTRSQDYLKHDALELFRPVERWSAVAEVAAVSDKMEITTSGEGRILVNGATQDKQIPYLLTKAEYGDVRVELEFMIPKNSNAGVYLMGRYEVQIFDSFGRQRAGSGDLGGIYESWDPARLPGKQGYEGKAPKTNAARPPGEWQTLDITFRAPRFDPSGAKTEDAIFEKIVANGVLVQENATVTGPTRSSPLEGEATRGPIAIQGDHGPIAIRAFRVTPLDEETKTRMKELERYWATVSRAVGEGDFNTYQKTCHPEGVLASGNRQMSQPLAVALARWKQEFTDTKAGRRKSSVEFRFSRRVGDATTAHESGIFLYTFQLPGAAPQLEFVHFECVLVKHPDGWKMLLENQIGPATEAEWKALE